MGDSPVRVGVYGRISEDRDGQQTATARQMQDARDFATKRDWEIGAATQHYDPIGETSLHECGPQLSRSGFASLLASHLDCVGVAVEPVEVD